jgi:hypothetical protein
MTSNTLVLDIVQSWIFQQWFKGIRESDSQEGKRLFGHANTQQVSISKQNILKLMHQHWCGWL